MIIKETPSKSGNQFAFVLVNRPHTDDDEFSSTSPKAIRAHATREGRRRKKEGGLTSHSARTAPLPFSTGRFRLSKQPNGKVLGSSGSNVVGKRKLAENDEIEEWATETIAKWPMELRPSELLDPFNSLPIVLGSRQQNLLRYCESENLFLFLSAALPPPKHLLSMYSRHFSCDMVLT
jgi:hypothetical protein